MAARNDVAVCDGWATVAESNARWAVFPTTHSSKTTGVDPTRLATIACDDDYRRSSGKEAWGRLCYRFFNGFPTGRTRLRLIDAAMFCHVVFAG